MSRGDAVPRRSARRAGRIFALPALIALVSIIGLVAALTGDGWRDAIAWAGLAVPVAATCRAWRRRH